MEICNFYRQFSFDSYFINLFSNLLKGLWKNDFCRLYNERARALQSSIIHVKISQLVASLQTSRQQVVFARLVTSCQQVWNKLLTTCNNLVDIIRLVTRLFQQGCYSHDITILLQPCVVNLVTFLLYIMTVSALLEQLCNKSDNVIMLVTSC